VYTKFVKRIPIIAGRHRGCDLTTPLLRRDSAGVPPTAKAWLTHTPEISPQQEVEKSLVLIWPGAVPPELLLGPAFTTQTRTREACASTTQLFKPTKIAILSPEVPFKWPLPTISGLTDCEPLATPTLYVEEIFEICGWELKGKNMV